MVLNLSCLFIIMKMLHKLIQIFLMRIAVHACFEKGWLQLYAKAAILQVSYQMPKGGAPSLVVAFSRLNSPTAAPATFSRWRF